LSNAALYDSLDSLAQGIEEMGGMDPAYFQKMMHKIPEAPSVQRVPWLLNRLAGKVLLDVGCHGPLHVELLKVCTRAYGVDHEPASYPDYHQMDLESDELPVYNDVEVVLLGEVVEHLMSPGVLLWQVREKYPRCEVIVTVPNAFSSAGQAWIRKGIEQVNADHTAWYSYMTLKTLVEKCGFQVQEWYWNGGQKYVAEGLIFVCQTHASIVEEVL
jgi:2-polyprenyl-3-methyl-5-hydroxy-6-metoxy-1,4-benzoquinol methylase